jgi:GxxExxY protein
MKYDQQCSYDVVYKDTKVGENIPDFVVGDAVVVDTKVIPKITDTELGQMLNYLKITELKVGLILNFKNARLEWKRVVLDH